MLEFTTPANGWDVLFTALLTGGSVVLAFFLGRASERSQQRWQRFDAWALRAVDVQRTLRSANAKRRALTPAEDRSYINLTFDGFWPVDFVDREFVNWVLDQIDAFYRYLHYASTLQPDGFYTVDSIEREWAKMPDMRPEGRLMFLYRDSREERRKLQIEAHEFMEAERSANR